VWHSSFAVFDPVAAHLTYLEHVQHVLRICLALRTHCVVAAPASTRVPLMVPRGSIDSTDLGE